MSEQTPDVEAAMSELDKCIEVGTKAWKGVPGTWLEEFRGNQIEVEILRAPKSGLSVEQILKLVCEHTGRRISLNLTEIDQHIEFARAIERLTKQGQVDGSDACAELGLHNVKTRAQPNPADAYHMNLDNGVADYD